ncbi:4-aminobutyrate--2-oxoglutarate transaminase [Burkholderia contaminans]|uniref:4-aminobutyrate--2-oxoglutarate transaminase n=1 Tax=Burkholderia contaminans TaxID=488447 RepID=UPI001CF2F302|nr:4-aminobutyrate--2-oxoglutarate transaminase [Burkholderia contaminans]MCA8369539.1 4-aminobutyrate--2-oxoglutarate transaminase [Burkholderia contaminans]
MSNNEQTNKALMARRARAVPQGIGNAHPVFAERAENGEIWDVEGKRYIDFCAGIAVLNTGHRHPKVSAAVAKQAEKFSHTCFQVVAYESYVELAERLSELAPGQFPKKAFFMTTGAEAVENAVKVARYYTKRSAVISFDGAFHGRTFMAMALTGKVAPYKAGFGPMSAEVYQAPFPSELHGVSVDDAIYGLERLFKYTVDPQRVAAIIVEPVQGEGGYTPAPTEFLKRLRNICDTYGIVFIADEIQTGVGRTGRMFAMEHSGVVPDLTTMAKGLGGGMTISAVVGRAYVLDSIPPGGLGSTYAGHPMACVASLAVLDVMEEESLCARSEAIGERLRSRFNGLRAHVPEIADVRGLGAMTGIEFMKNGQPAPDIVTSLKAEAQKEGLLLLTCGSYGNVLRIMLPLTASNALIDEGMDIIEGILLKLTAGAGVVQLA